MQYPLEPTVHSPIISLQLLSHCILDGNGVFSGLETFPKLEKKLKLSRAAGKHIFEIASREDSDQSVIAQSDQRLH